MSSALFSPIALRDLTLANRIVVSPMCQYSANDGSATDWHLMHLGQMAISGAALVFVEATAVEPRGRITPHCLGLYSDENEAALARVLDFCWQHGNAKMGIQLGHAGRKASSHTPAEGRHPLLEEEGAWRTVAPSPLSTSARRPAPHALDQGEMAAMCDAFVAATERALRLGFDTIELHMAHGYLLHEFLSPVSNRRDDDYGGSIDNRMRFPFEVFEAVRRAWPQNRPLGVRISASDWVEGGWEVGDSIEFAGCLRDRGCDYVCASSGGVSNEQRITLGPGYQVPFAAAIRRHTRMNTMAVGMIFNPFHAESIVADGEADMVALARGMLYHPRWTWHAAETLGAEAAYPVQYERSRPSAWPEAFGDSAAAD